ncbi:hypothetical protein R3W88_027095 [Solanum pinnatisectum]|uniref:Uncharacterized protein n=1 Tax=Solanum pinnatisectum TaxID=50273 RepID=A0AAV9LF15_9SOLN|nr:hypothetical protein R3W88_027095 [Solanum pinnatisectum]
MPKQVQPQKLSEFENVSTKPPEQLLRRTIFYTPTKEKKECSFPSTDQFFEQPSSPIAMNFTNNYPINVVVVEVEEQILVPKQKVVEGDDICKNQSVMENVTEPPSTTDHIHVPAEASVSNKDLNDVADEGPKTTEEDFTTLISIFSKTQEAIDALLSSLCAPIVVQPLNVVSPHELTNNNDFLSDSQLPTEISGKEITLHDDTKTPATQNRIPSKIFQSPYLTIFGSSEKGKDKLDFDIRQNFPFEGCGICYQPQSDLMDYYCQ